MSEERKVAVRGMYSLEESAGVHSGFNMVITDRSQYDSYDDWLAANASRMRGSLTTWLDKENFEKFEDEEIDLAILYEYYEDGQDLDNLFYPVVKPLVTSLDNSSGHSPYLVEDDSQIIRILLKSVQREASEHEQTDVPIPPKEYEEDSGPLPEDLDEEDWRHSHGRITISFRAHDPEKPMKLTSSNVI